MRKKGASLIWALLVSLALLFITVTTANFVIKESQMSIRMDDSSRAYAAAESGIEWGKYCIAKGRSECSANGNVAGPFNVGGSTYTVTFNRTPDIKIESIGTSNGVNRKLEYKVNPNASLTPIADPLGVTFTTAGSYIQQFDYWTADKNSLGSNIVFIVGVASADTSQAIYMEHNTTSGLTLVSNINGTIFNRSAPISLTGIDTPYALRVRIEYYKDLSAKMIVSKRDDKSSTGYTCAGTAVLDMRGSVRGADMAKFYYSAVPDKQITQAYGDDSYYSLTTGSSVAYFDNMLLLGHVLTVTKSGMGSVASNYVVPASNDMVNCGLDCTGSYVGGTVVKLTPTPDTGHTFVSWSGCDSIEPTGNICVITMTSNRSVKATFN